LTPEGDGEQHELVRLVADGDDPRVGIGDPARLILILANTIDDISLDVLWMGPWTIDWADNVDL
jgi:hypothetical protein